MFDGSRAKNRDQSACHLPGTSLALHTRVTAPTRYTHPHRCVTFVIPHVIPSPVPEQRRINTFRKVRVQRALNGPSPQEFLSLYYKAGRYASRAVYARSEEHTSELQSPYDLVCRLLLEKK